jgi:hypothetical protein
MTKGIQHLDHVPMIRLSGKINPIWDQALRSHRIAAGIGRSIDGGSAVLALRAG